MSDISLEIKGRSWKFILLPDKRFDKLHNADGGLQTGITMANQFEVHFRKSDWCITDIRHELCHVLKHMSHTSTVDLTAEDTEELMCELVASNYSEIGVWSDRIAEKFFGRE